VSVALSEKSSDADGAAGREIQKHFQRISQLAEIIEHGASRTAKIVSDLKTFSHPGRETVETFNVHEALDVCLNLLSSRTKQGIRIRREYGADGMMKGPFGQLNQVFMNLLSNAQDAIQGAGEITVSTRDGDGRVIVSVKDTGAGIPAHVRSKIFDPFFTTKAPGKGTGLGLSISYSLVKKLGGTIEFESEIGAGTEFILSLPRCIDARSDHADREDSLAASSA